MVTSSPGGRPSPGLARAGRRMRAVASRVVDRLELLVGMEPLGPQFAAEPAGLAPSVGGGEVGKIAVEPDGAGTDAAGHLGAMVQVRGPDGAGEAVGRLVRQTHCL